MSQSDYYINAKGEHVMTYKVFSAMSFEKLCNLLKINPHGVSKK